MEENATKGERQKHKKGGNKEGERPAEPEKQFELKII